MRLLKLPAMATAAFLLAGCVAPAPRDTLVGDYLTGHLAARLNAVDDAAKFFAGAHAEAPQSDDILKEAFFFHIAAGDFEKGVYFARELVKREGAGGGDDGLARLVLSAAAMKNGDYTKARTLLSENVEATYFQPLRTIVDTWALKAIEGADAALLKLSQTKSGEFKGFNPLHQALLADQAGRTDETLAAFQLSVMTYGGPVGREAYGAYLERAGETETAREWYGILAQSGGSDRRIAEAGLRRLTGGAPSRKYENAAPAEGAAIGFYSFGAAFLEQTVNQRTAAEEAGFRLREENYNIPLVFAQTALFLDPDLDVARRFAGSILKVYGDNEKAIRLLSEIAPGSPYYEVAQIDTAGALVALEREEDAIGVLKSVLQSDDEALQARTMLSGLYTSLERHEEALAALDDVVARLPETPGPDAWRYFVSRGAAHLAVDDWPRAEEDLKRAVEIAPEEPTALNYLGYSWAERGENLEEAFAMIEKAVALDPTSGAIIDSLGWAHYQLGNYDEAVGHLEHAATLEPSDPTVTDHLGDVYWRLGRTIEARYQWRHALELEPDDALKKALEEKIENGLVDLAD